MKQFLIAPDSFKGSLSAIQFCDIAENVIYKNDPSHQVFSFPLSDGGEGFIDALVTAGKAQAILCDTVDPLGRPIEAAYGWIAESKTAIIEMAQASGITLLSEGEKNPEIASTYGTGVLIQSAIHKGAETIIMGLGGSATNDGGAGALAALGIEFFGEEGRIASMVPKALTEISRIAADGALAMRSSINWVLACDVTNPLLGEEGATAVFGPQKGVTEHNHQGLENGLTHWADQLQATFGVRTHDLPSAGAAGGMASGFIAVFNAEIRPGFEVLSKLIELETVFELNHIDYVITGEGRMDYQTNFGKLPSRVAGLAKIYQAETYGICGTHDGSDLEGFTEIIPLVFQLPDDSEAKAALFAKTPDNLQAALSELIDRLA